jgi:hypothetical protein
MPAEWWRSLIFFLGGCKWLSGRWSLCQGRKMAALEHIDVLLAAQHIDCDLVVFKNLFYVLKNCPQLLFT